MKWLLCLSVSLILFGVFLWNESWDDDITRNRDVFGLSAIILGVFLLTICAYVTSPLLEFQF